MIDKIICLAIGIVIGVIIMLLFVALMTSNGEISPKSYRKKALEAINEIGGCDATDEYSKGWDDAIDTAYEVVSGLE